VRRQAWLSEDFRQERRWKVALAARLSMEVAAYFAVADKAALCIPVRARSAVKQETPHNGAAHQSRQDWLHRLVGAHHQAWQRGQRAADGPLSKVIDATSPLTDWAWVAHADPAAAPAAWTEALLYDSAALPPADGSSAATAAWAPATTTSADNAQPAWERGELVMASRALYLRKRPARARRLAAHREAAIRKRLRLALEGDAAPEDPFFAVNGDAAAAAAGGEDAGAATSDAASAVAARAPSGGDGGAATDDSTVVVSTAAPSAHDGAPLGSSLGPGDWTADEDRRLLQAVRTYGPNWSIVADVVTRTAPFWSEFHVREHTPKACSERYRWLTAPGRPAADLSQPSPPPEPGTLVLGAPPRPPPERVDLIESARRLAPPRAAGRHGSPASANSLLITGVGSGTAVTQGFSVPAGPAAAFLPTIMGQQPLGAPMTTPGLQRATRKFSLAAHDSHNIALVLNDAHVVPGKPVTPLELVQRRREAAAAAQAAALSSAAAAHGMAGAPGGGAAVPPGQAPAAAGVGATNAAATLGQVPTQTSHLPPGQAPPSAQQAQAQQMLLAGRGRPPPPGAPVMAGPGVGASAGGANGGGGSGGGAPLAAASAMGRTGPVPAQPGAPLATPLGAAPYAGGGVAQAGGRGAPVPAAPAHPAYANRPRPRPGAPGYGAPPGAPGTPAGGPYPQTVGGPLPATPGGAPRYPPGAAGGMGAPRPGYGPGAAIGSAAAPGGGAAAGQALPAGSLAAAAAAGQALAASGHAMRPGLVGGMHGSPSPVGSPALGGAMARAGNVRPNGAQSRLLHRTKENEANQQAIFSPLVCATAASPVMGQASVVPRSGVPVALPPSASGANAAGRGMQADPMNAAVAAAAAAAAATGNGSGGNKGGAPMGAPYGGAAYPGVGRPGGGVPGSNGWGAAPGAAYGAAGQAGGYGGGDGAAMQTDAAEAAPLAAPPRSGTPNRSRTPSRGQRR